MRANLWKTLQVGDAIRIIGMPDEIWAPHGETKALFERLVREGVGLRVTRVDEHGYPWIEYAWKADDGAIIHEYLMIHHDEIEIGPSTP
jgi:hypothetical protein